MYSIVGKLKKEFNMKKRLDFIPEIPEGWVRVKNRRIIRVGDRMWVNYNDRPGAFLPPFEWETDWMWLGRKIYWCDVIIRKVS